MMNERKMRDCNAGPNNGVEKKPCIFHLVSKIKVLHFQRPLWGLMVKPLDFHSAKLVRTNPTVCRMSR